MTEAADEEVLVRHLQVARGRIANAARAIGVPQRLRDDIVSEAVAQLVGRARNGALSLPVSRRMRTWVLIDAIRDTVGRDGRRAPPPMDVGESVLWDQNQRLPGFRDPMAPEVTDDADGLRRLYETEGGWTPAFEAALRVLLVARPSVAPAGERVIAWIRGHTGEPATHAEIADAVGLCREEVSRVLGRLRRAGTLLEEEMGRGRAYALRSPDREVTP